MHRGPSFPKHQQQSDYRSGGVGYPPFSTNAQSSTPAWSHSGFMAEENERLTQELTDKVTGLRSLSIRIGDELREQHSLLSGMAGAFNRSEGLLRSTMSRVLGLGKNSSSTALYCYLLCFASLSTYSSTENVQYDDDWSSRFRIARQWVVLAVLISIVVGVLFYDEGHPERNSKLSVLFRYNGTLLPDEIFLVHLVIPDGDVLVKLSPVAGDPDLFVAVGKNREILINRLSEPHRSRCTPKQYIYQLNTIWEQLINPHVPDDVYQLFSYQSASLGVEELVVGAAQSTDSRSAGPVQPILIAVRPYPNTAETCEFILEVSNWYPRLLLLLFF
ncbi:unnamed protein product [Echinostoma caproni]|uniref:t-SNARE coiled-coil homology domain-containing protein n=1 Tax=Echinostoma caproni TaxID=27848 RepID=A0A183AW82_9TREM|nr:unnamed protein product [Echinostoma caproni]